MTTHAVAKFFPTLMIIISGCSAAMYAMDRDWRHAIYWTAATVLTASVTF